jgi:hypothetical protein
LYSFVHKKTGVWHEVSKRGTKSLQATHLMGGLPKKGCKAVTGVGHGEPWSYFRETMDTP